MTDSVFFANFSWWGSLTSIVGLLVGLVGFGITIVNVRKTKSATEASAQAVNKVQQDISRMYTVSDFSTVLAEMEEIKRLHRSKSWALLPDFYSRLRKSLVSIKSGASDLTAAESRDIQSAITQLAELERAVDDLVENKGDDLDISEANSALSRQIDRLTTVLVRLRNDIGESA